MPKGSDNEKNKTATTITKHLSAEVLYHNFPYFSIVYFKKTQKFYSSFINSTATSKVSGGTLFVSGT